MRIKYFVTSDLHFGHCNILKYCPNRTLNSKIVNIKDHDELIIKRWNSRVKISDIVIVCGDVKMCGNQHARKCISRLNGKKILIRGNHDESIRKMMNFGFDWVCDSMSLNLGGHYVLLSHYPWRISKFKEYILRFKQFFHKREIYNFKNMQKQPRYSDKCVLFYGHTHQTEKIKKDIPNAIHVGLDSWDMYPASEDELVSLIGKMKKVNWRDK